MYLDYIDDIGSITKEEMVQAINNLVDSHNSLLKMLEDYSNGLVPPMMENYFKG